MTGRFTLEVTPEQKRKIDWLVAHEEEIEQSLKWWRDASSIIRFSRIVWLFLIGLGSLITSVLGYITFKRG